MHDNVIGEGSGKSGSGRANDNFILLKAYGSVQSKSETAGYTNTLDFHVHHKQHSHHPHHTTHTSYTQHQHPLQTTSTTNNTLTRNSLEEASSTESREHSLPLPRISNTSHTTTHFHFELISQVLVHLHYRRHVPTTITVVRSGPHCHQLLIEHELVSLHHQLVRTTQQLQIVRLVELTINNQTLTHLLHAVTSKHETTTSRIYTPSTQLLLGV